MTWAEFYLRYEAYIRIIEKHEVADWNRTRWTVHQIACMANEKNRKLTIFDILQLPGDPSKEERLKMKQEAIALEAKEALEAIRNYGKERPHFFNVKNN